MADFMRDHARELSWCRATVKMPVYTPTLPPGSAKALGSGRRTPRSPNRSASRRKLARDRSDDALHFARLARVGSCVSALDFGEGLRAELVEFLLRTPPTTWVRPVGDVVVAQAATGRDGDGRRRGFRRGHGRDPNSGCGA
jgi:hypothetical protein